MKSNSKKESIVVLCDFDGTITTEDTNTKLLNKFGDKDFMDEQRRRFYKGDIDVKTLANIQFGEIKLLKESYLNFILNEIELQKGFSTFYSNLEKNNIPFIIVSGGFEMGIMAFLEKHDFKNIPIYAHQLTFFEKTVKIDFYDERYLSHLIHRVDYKDFKMEIGKKYKEKYDKIVFIGDGFTDINMIDVADYLFAKDYLEQYCLKNNIDYMRWKDFEDINKWLFYN